jgi:hypothetical protein
MREKLLNMVEAAREAGISERTVQRYVNSGLLTWRGTIRRGPRAAGIRLAELLRVAKRAGRDGRRRKNRVPAWTRITNRLAQLPFTSGSLITQLVRAIRGGACSDLARVGISEICRGDKDFSLILMGKEQDRPTDMDPLRFHAAGRLHEVARRSDDGVQLPSTLRDRLKLLAFTWIKETVPVVEPVIRYNPKTRRAQLALSPHWLIGAPVGTLPFSDGDTIAKLYRDHRLKYVDTLITKAARRLLSGRRPGAFDDEFRVSIQYLLNMEPFQYSAGDETGLREWFAARYDLTLEQAKLIDKLVRRVRADAVDRARHVTRPHTDDVAVDEMADANDPESEQARYAEPPAENADADELSDDEQAAIKESKLRTAPAYRVIGSMFGISRQAARRWIIGGRRLYERFGPPATSAG